MRHHENRVFGQGGEAFWLKRIHQHQCRLRHAGSVRKHTTGSHQQVELHGIHNGGAAGLLAEGVTHGSLLLHTLQRGRELFVLHVGQTQRFAGYGLFKHECFTTLRNRGGSNHLVLDPVAKLTLVHAFQMNPAQYVVEPGLGHHVRDGVAHPQVGRDSSVEHAVKDTEDVGGGPANVDRQSILALTFRDGGQDVPHRTWGRHDWRTGPAHQLVVARSLGHHMLKEHVMDGVSCGTKVFLFQSGAKVVHALQVDRLIKSVVDRTAGILVARKNHRHHKLAAEAGLRTSRRDAFGNFGDFLFVATIGSPREKNHVGTQLTDALDLLVWLPPIVGRDGVHHNGPRPQSGPLGALSGHLFNDTTHHHLQSPTRGTCRDVDVATNGIAIGVGARGLDDASVFVHQLSARHFTNFSDRVDHANGDIRERFFDGGGRFSPLGLTERAVRLPLDEHTLGGRRTAIGGKNHVDRVWIDGHALFSGSARCSASIASMRAVMKSMLPRCSRNVARCRTCSAVMARSTAPSTGSAKCSPWATVQFNGLEDSSIKRIGEVMPRRATQRAKASTAADCSGVGSAFSPSTAKA